MAAHRPLSAEHAAYLATRMTEVSRSFALVVPRIEKPLGDYLATAYLICRVVDNVEDCTAPDDWRLERFAELDSLLADCGTADRVLSRWQGLAWPGLTGEERRLMSLAGGGPLWAVYWSMPAGARGQIRTWVQAMIDGMRGLTTDVGSAWTLDGSRVRRLRGVDDYNRYCFVVAGTVGRMATELAVDQFGLAVGPAERLRALSDACGRGLQKTNIVKDFVDDLARGICYLPDDWLSEIGRAPLALLGAPVEWTRHVIGDVLAELREATEYVRVLPVRAHGYRLGSLLCLLPAYATLVEAARRSESLFTRAHRVKISRAVMAGCLAEASAIVGDNEAILAHSRRAEAALELALAAPRTDAAP